jgi:hypothetical protein
MDQPITTNHAWARSPKFNTSTYLSESHYVCLHCKLSYIGNYSRGYHYFDASGNEVKDFEYESPYTLTTCDKFVQLELFPLDIRYFNDSIDHNGEAWSVDTWNRWGKQFKTWNGKNYSLCG